MIFFAFRILGIDPFPQSVNNRLIHIASQHCMKIVLIERHNISLYRIIMIEIHLRYRDRTGCYGTRKPKLELLSLDRL